MNQTKKKWKFKFKAPPVIVILFIILFIVMVFTWIPLGDIVEGKYWRKGENGELIEEQITKDNPLRINSLGILDPFMSIFKGFQDRADFISFLFMLGAFLHLMMQTKAIDASLGKLIKKLGNKEYILIPIIMFVVSLLGTIYGFAEETLALYPILVPIILMAGFDKMTVLFILFLGSTAGVAGSVVNPFSMATSSKVAAQVVEQVKDIVNITTGIWIRIVVWLILTIGFIVFTTLYAIRVKKNKNYSLVSQTIEEDKKNFASTTNFDDIPPLTNKRILALVIFGLTFLFIVLFSLPYRDWGFEGFDKFHESISKSYITSFINPIGRWYFSDYAFLLMISTFLLGFIVLRMEIKTYLKNVNIGWGDFTNLVLTLSVASGISYMLDESNLGKYIVTSFKNAGLAGMNRYLFIIMLIAIFMLLGLVITSTSTMAFLTFPFVAPLAYAIGEHIGKGGGVQLIGICMSLYMLALNFISLFTPTNLLFMAPLDMYNIPINKWYKGIIIPATFLFVITLAVPLILVSFIG
ncbi:MAG: hypothetical protein E7Y34_00215 [Mycoplasma sp.]|nr:hypothetical protein [Mycoplasma sp.]